MRFWLAAALLLSSGARAQTAGPWFAETLPPGIVDVTGWEQVGGEFATPLLRGGYLFYVNPERLAMYQLMRYRVQRLPSATGPGEAAPGAERVAFIRRPGAREPIHCWERQGPGVVPEWRPFEPGTAEYRSEMALLGEVLAIHRAALPSR
jgi:hypothetical protein